MKKRMGNVLVAVICCLLVACILGIGIYFLTFPSYNDGIKKFAKVNNFTYSVNLSADGEIFNEKTNINSKIEDMVNKKDGISVGSFISSYGDIKYQNQFMIKKSGKEYLLYTEKMSSWVSEKINKNYYLSLLDELSKIENMEKTKSKNVFSLVSYKTNISKNQLGSILKIYDKYFDIKEESLKSDKYDVVATLNHKGFLEKIEIDLNDKIDLDDEIKASNVKLIINFNKYNKTLVNDINTNLSVDTNKNDVLLNDILYKSKSLFGKKDEYNKSLFLEKIEVYAPDNGIYSKNQVINFKAVWTTDVYSGLGDELNKITAPSLYIRFGDKGLSRKANFVSAKGNEIYYEYKLNIFDEGKLSLSKYFGYVYDKNRNRGIIPDIELSGNTDIVAKRNDSLKPGENPGENPEENSEQKPEEKPGQIPEEKPEQKPEENSGQKPEENPEQKPEENSGQIPNSQLNPEEIRKLLKNSYHIISGVDKALPEVISQLKALNIDFSSLTLKDLINFAKEVKRVYGVEKDTGVVTYTKSNDFARLTTYSNGDNEKGPIIIIPGVLHANGKDEQVYVVSLGGTEFVDGQATDIATDILTGFELNNDYLTSVYDAIINNVPFGSKLIINGISLGGMVAQQVAAQDGIKDFYEVLNIVTYGSPIITPSLREGVTRRLCDSSDIVPILSVSNNTDNIAEYDSVEKAVENGGYKSFLSAHTFSYIDNAVWNNYDVLGFKGGNASITVDYNKIKFYDALLEDKK